MKKSVRKRRKTSGITIQKSGSGFILTKKQFWVWGLSISVLLVLLALSVDYFSNSVSYAYDDINNDGGLGELYNTRGIEEISGLGGVCGKNVPHEKIVTVGSNTYVDTTYSEVKCDKCLKCDLPDLKIIFFTASWCGPCQTFHNSPGYQIIKKGYPLLEDDISNGPSKNSQHYGITEIPQMIVVNNDDKDDKGFGKIICGPINPNDGKSLNELLTCYKKHLIGVCIPDPGQRGKECKEPEGSNSYVCDNKGNCISK